MRTENVFDRLPDSLVLQILVCLPEVGDIQRVAATCKRFRNLTEWVEELTFDFNKVHRARKRDLGVAYMLARLAKGALKRVTFIAHHGECFDYASVRFWIASVSPGVEQLTVQDGDDLMIDLGTRLEAASLCPHLSKLHLTGSRTDPMLEFEVSKCEGGFRVLHTLTLTNAHMSDEMLEQLLSVCPKLRVLEVDSLTGVSKVKIQSNSLEYLRMNTSENWLEDQDAEFETVTLVTPALRTLVLGDLDRALTIREAPLQTLTLQGIRDYSVVNLGCKAELRSLTLCLDNWPPFYTDPLRALTMGGFMDILKKTKPQALRTLVVPSISVAEPVQGSLVQAFLKHIEKLQTFEFPASLALALGCSDDESGFLVGEVCELLQECNFRNLSEIDFYVDHADPGCFGLVEGIAQRSRRLKRLRVHANPGVYGFRLAGNFISRVLSFQHSNPRTLVSMELPKVLCVD